MPWLLNRCIGLQRDTKCVVFTYLYFPLQHSFPFLFLFSIVEFISMLVSMHNQNGERKIELESFISLKQASVRGLLNLHTRMSKVHAGGWVRGWQRFSHV